LPIRVWPSPAIAHLAFSDIAITYAISGRASSGDGKAVDRELIAPLRGVEKGDFMLEWSFAFWAKNTISSGFGNEHHHR
jgi:hypothetical protein